MQDPHGPADSPAAAALDPEVTDRLRALERAVSPEEICELWIFPPLADVEGSAEFFLFTLFLEEDRRALCSARPRPTADGEPREDPSDGGEGSTTQEEETIVQHGSVPADRLPRLVERFRERLGEDEEPLHFRIDGSEARWRGLVRIDREAASP